MPFHTSANASVAVRIESRDLRPGARRRSGQRHHPDRRAARRARRHRARHRRVREHARDRGRPAAGAVHADVDRRPPRSWRSATSARSSTFGVTTRGQPIAQGATTLRASEGMVHPLGSGAPGEERFLIEAPQKVGSGAMHLTATAVDVAPEPLLVLEKRVEAVIPLVAAPAEHLTLAPSTDHLIIGDDAGATVTVDGHRPPRQPGVVRRCAGDRRRTSDRRRRPTARAAASSTIAAPAKPSRTAAWRSRRGSASSARTRSSA